ncbi:protein-tyrosine phosphatase family protein [Specibacter sp. NPDC057265]|uniref:protein-tyrosine phosphatase family protein n=1 Tax=Specibacter sp. NPDC057265 TaxID=3346075 RepID=UPI0036330F7C
MNTWTGQRGVVMLPDGRQVRGTGVRQSRGSLPDPDFAVYLLGRDPGARPWDSQWVKWRDFSIPASTPAALDALQEAFARSLEERVEIACGSGVGRTGTALALMAVMAGLPASDAAAWVRRSYHRRAIETRGQRRWVLDAARML